VTDQVYRRRRESDRAEQRAALAIARGDHAGYLMAIAQAKAARQRREAWAHAAWANEAWAKRQVAAD
jgi:hypothetical protein